MVDYLETVHGPVLGIDFPWGVVVQGGHQMQWQPFEFDVAQQDGTWNPAPFVAAIRDHYYAVIYTKGGIGGGPVAAAIASNYHEARNISGYQILLRDSPPTVAPPTIPEPVPHPLPALGRYLEHLPHALWLGLRRHLVPAHMRSVGAFTEINIVSKLNLIGVENPGQPAANPQGFDSGGNFLSTVDDFPPPGTFMVQAQGQRVPFYVPQAGSAIRSILELTGPTTIAVPPGRYSAVWLLEAAVDLTQRAAVTLNYQGAIPWNETIAFSDWCAPPGPTETIAFRGSARLDAQGQSEPPPCGMFAMRLVTNPNEVLTSLQFGVNSLVQIAAVTVQKA